MKQTSILEVYKKYKHLDRLLSDKEWLKGGDEEMNLPMQTLYDFWQVIKVAAEKEIAD